jgi:hypothetical protein
MIRLLKALVMATGVSVAAVAGFWTQDREIPVQSKAVEIVGPVYPGGKVLVRWNVFRERACRATRQDLVIDVNSLRWIVASMSFDGPPGPLGFDTYVTATALPIDIPTGPAVLRVTLTYKCNPIHDFWPVVSQTPDIPITILPRP